MEEVLFGREDEHSLSLRAPISHLNVQYQGSGSPSTISPEPDYTDYTPLKKRRLANYREAEEEVRAASEKVRTPVLCICTIYNPLFAPCAKLYLPRTMNYLRLFAGGCRHDEQPPNYGE